MKIEMKLVELTTMIAQLEAAKLQDVTYENYRVWYEYQQLDTKIAQCQQLVHTLRDYRQLDVVYDDVYREFQQLDPVQAIEKWSLLYQYHKFYELVVNADGKNLTQLQTQYELAKAVANCYA